MVQRLEKIHIEGYKSIKEMDLEIKNLNVLIGANGSGKSNFIGIFKFLRQIVEQRLQITVREAGGADSFLYYGSKETTSLNIQLDFDPNYYNLDLGIADNDSLFVKYEKVGFQGNGFNDPLWRILTEGTLETKIKDVAQSGTFSRHTYPSLSSWRVYHFHDTSAHAAVKKFGNINDNEFLREDAANLAAFLYRMQKENLKHYERIVKTIQWVVPMFSDFKLRPNPHNKETIRLEWNDKNSDYPFGASHLSDGSLRFICLTAMLLQPNRPDLILVDEPELGLHPMAIQILAGLLQKVSHLSQLIISTQSAELVSTFEAENIIVVENKEGVSTFTRLKKGQLDNWLGEYSLGEIWEKNVIGGRP